MHDSDVVPPRVRPSDSRAEPLVAWMRARVRITAAPHSRLVKSWLPFPLFSSPADRGPLASLKPAASLSLEASPILPFDRCSRLFPRLKV